MIEYTPLTLEEEATQSQPEHPFELMDNNQTLKLQVLTVTLKIKKVRERERERERERREKREREFYYLITLFRNRITNPTYPIFYPIYTIAVLYKKKSKHSEFIKVGSLG